MSRAGGPSFAAAMTADPAEVPHLLEAMAGLQAQIHATAAPRLPDLKARPAANLERAPGLDTALRRRLLDGLAAMPNGDRLCHGDFRPRNVLGSPSAAVVVDWLDACRGHPAADLCRSWVLMRPAMQQMPDAYLDAYARIGGITRKEALDWLPFVAGARLAEGVEGEAAALRVMAGAPG